MIKIIYRAYTSMVCSNNCCANYPNAKAIISEYKLIEIHGKTTLRWWFLRIL